MQWCGTMARAMSTAKKSGTQTASDTVVIVNRAEGFRCLAYVGQQTRLDASGSKDMVRDLKPSELRLDPGVNYIPRADYDRCGGALEGDLNPLESDPLLSEANPLNMDEFSAIAVAKISENPKAIKQWLSGEKRLKVKAALRVRLTIPKAPAPEAQGAEASGW